MTARHVHDRLLECHLGNITRQPDMDVIVNAANAELRTGLQAYREEGLNDQAVFSLFVRCLPAGRNYLLACGLDTVLGQLENLSFAPADLEYLASLGTFKDSFLQWLADFRFSGDVFAVAEGTPVFANEPILPGRKQVFREHKDGIFSADTIGRVDEDLPGTPLLQPVMRNGRRLPDHVRDLDAIRKHARSQIDQLPAAIQGLMPPDTPYPVHTSQALQQHQAQVTRVVSQG
jgi:hypothetical protein